MPMQSATVTYKHAYIHNKNKSEIKMYLHGLFDIWLLEVLHKSILHTVQRSILPKAAFTVFSNDFGLKSSNGLGNPLAPNGAGPPMVKFGENLSNS